MREKTQINAIREHLKKKKSITSWEAIQKYGATRLSGIIHQLRHKEEWQITTENKVVNNRYGHHSNIAVYKLKKVGGIKNITKA